ncbi:nucleoside 2-deoxyribosyltransferase, partial [bacterium]|nr:nucleoside 2-deoxyribosyltransferase [bacterium]
MNYQPNFERLKTTLFGGKADRVPLMELSVDLKIQGQFIGRPIENVRDRIEFAQKAGYDFVRLAPIIDFNPERIQPKEGARSSEESATDTAREWHSEGVGIITTLADFEKFRWPELHEVSYQLFDDIQPHLPDGMKIIGQYGDIFTWIWDFMGFETFSFAMVDNE